MVLQYKAYQYWYSLYLNQWVVRFSTTKRAVVTCSWWLKKHRAWLLCMYVPCSQRCLGQWNMGCKWRPQKNYHLNAHSSGNRCESFAHWIIYIYWWSSHPLDWFMSKPHQYFCHLPAYPKYGQCTVPLRFNLRKIRQSSKQQNTSTFPKTFKVMACGCLLV